MVTLSSWPSSAQASANEVQEITVTTDFPDEVQFRLGLYGQFTGMCTPIYPIQFYITSTWHTYFEFHTFLCWFGHFKIWLFCQINLLSWIGVPFGYSGCVCFFMRFEKKEWLPNGPLKFDDFEWPASLTWKNHFWRRIFCNSSNEMSSNTEQML